MVWSSTGSNSVSVSKSSEFYSVEQTGKNKNKRPKQRINRENNKIVTQVQMVKRRRTQSTHKYMKRNKTKQNHTINNQLNDC